MTSSLSSYTENSFESASPNTKQSECEVTIISRPTLTKHLQVIVDRIIEKNDLDEIHEYLTKSKRRNLNKIFLWACSNENLFLVKILIDHGIDVCCADSNGATALHHAVHVENLELVLLLLNNGAKHEEWMIDDETLLHWACRYGYESIVRCLLDLGVKVTIPDGCGRYALHTACLHGAYNVVPVLIDMVDRKIGPDGISSERYEDRNLPHSKRVTFQNHRGNFPFIIDQVGVDTLDSNGWTPFHYACTSSSGYATQVVKELLKAKADPLVTTPNDKTALDLAFESGRDYLFTDNLEIEEMLRLIMKMDTITTPKSGTKQHYGSFESIDSDEDEEFEDSDNGGYTKRNSRFFSKMKRHYSFLHEDFNKMSDGKSRFAHPRIRYQFEEAYNLHQNIKDWSLKSIWKHIIRNDDVELLTILRDFRVNESEMSTGGNMITNFEDAYIMHQRDLGEIHLSCFENGLEIFTVVKNRFYDQLSRYDYMGIFQKLTKFEIYNVMPDMIEGCAIMWPLSSGILFIALLCGRFRIVEMLLRMRQFDILPSIFVTVLVLRKFEADFVFSAQAKTTLRTFSNKLELLAVDIMNRIFLKDNTEGKHATIVFLKRHFGCIGRSSIIDIAAISSCETFLSLPCSQMVIYKLWHGKLSWFPYHWKVVSVICPFLLPLHNLMRQNTDYKTSFLKSTSHSFMNSYFQTANIPPSNNERSCSFSQQKKDHFDSGKKMSWLYQLTVIKSAFKTPFNRFVYHSLSHLVFLCLFSYVLLYDFNPHISNIESFCYLFVIGYSAEEVNLVIKKFTRRKIREFLFNIWNIFDMAGITFCIIGFFLRLHIAMETNGGYFNRMHYLTSHSMFVARSVLLTGLLCFYLRFLFAFTIFPRLGPKLQMMLAMIRNDLCPMLSIFLLFFISFGVAFQAILYPNGYDVTLSATYERQTMQKIISNIAYMSFFGMMAAEYNVERLEQKGSGTCNSTKCRHFLNTSQNVFIFAFYILYIVIVNIMLVNLLIALYSNTISRINEKSRALWLADKYHLTHDYLSRTVLPPPLNLFFLGFELITYCFKNISKTKIEFELDKCSCKIKRYIIVQACALKGHRHILGQSEISETKEIKNRLMSLEKQLLEIRYILKGSQQKLGGQQPNNFLIKKSWFR